MTRAVLGLSGGVDSAVAAAFLAERGYEVHALFLDFGHGGADRARQAAAQLSLPFHIRPAAAALEEWVCAPFCRSYAAGLTPSPCIDCNERVKFPALFSFAQEIGAAVVATGHYARIRGGRLYRSPSDKDQSYLLYRLPLWMQARLIFPWGRWRARRRCAPWPPPGGWPPPGPRTAWTSALFPMGTMSPIWNSTACVRRRGTLSMKRGGCWAGTGASTVTPRGSAGAWASAPPGGCMSSGWTRSKTASP